MQEVWKDIKDYEGSYQVSNLGRIKRIALYTNQYKKQWKSNKILNTNHTDLRGYCHVVLCKDGISHCYKVHRLVAQAFIPNPDNLPQINHIDGNKVNNSVDNLEWCTASENMYHSYRKLHRKSAVAKKINQYDLNNNFIKTWLSSAEIEKHLGVNHSNIASCCKNIRNTAGGFIWRYADN